MLIVIASTLVGATILIQSKVTQTEQKYQRQFQELRDADSKKTIEYKQRLEDSSKLIEELKVQLQSKLDAKARLAAQQAAQAAAVTKVASQAVPHANAAPAAPARATGSCGEWMAAAGVTDTANATWLINKESGCNPGAVNKSSGACGIPQALPCSKLGTSDPVAQIRWMQNYVNQRYGGWAGAVAWHKTHNWY